MKIKNSFFVATLSKTPSAIGHIGLILALGFVCAGAASGSTIGKVFNSPEQAVAALGSAASSGDTNALRSILGPEADDLQNPDRVQATNDLATFTAALMATNRLVRVSGTNMILEVGEDRWPFPIPIAKRNDGWYFDTEAGKDELLTRRIGKNELATLKVVRAYVDAQREYASRDRDGDKVLEFAQNIMSSPGKKDGLYWPDDLDGELSPLGPLLAEAQVAGYKTRSSAEASQREPYHGYYFKILTSQGKHAPGGKYDYIINGNMIGGFGLVAWPAEYGGTGVMTFIVNQQGLVYQRDLGEGTSKIVSQMKTYDPDNMWRLSPD
jgi:hypothetical protein